MLTSRSPHQIFNRVPILISYQSAVLLDSELVPQEVQFSLKITPPASALPGIEQTLRVPIIIPFRLNETLLLSLVPSSCYQSPGSYQVEFYRRGSDLPFQRELWEVPDLTLSVRSVSLVRADGSLIDPLPVIAASVSRVSWGTADDYKFQANSIMWVNPPPPGTVYTVEFLEALSLADLKRNPWLAPTYEISNFSSAVPPSVSPLLSY